MTPSEAEILEFLETRSRKPLKAKELARALQVPPEKHAAFRLLLKRMATRGLIYPVKGQRYALPDRLNLVVGRLQVVRSGAGFVVPEDRGHADVFVPAYKLETAAHGDRVVARVEKQSAAGNPEGRIIRVLERARSRLVGTFMRSRHFAFVKPDERRLTFDVLVDLEEGLVPEEGQKVLVEIDDWGDAHKNPEGTILQVLGFPHEPGVDVLSIIHDHGLEPEFPPAVEEAAQVIPAQIPAAEIRRRLDLRSKLCFTIDPADAKDFDDALSIEALEAGDGGGWQVGVHIADVSYYVESGTLLDEEAERRGTSVYLVDRVIPMLPEKLSNHLCSLNPGEDKLTLTVLMKLDARGALRASRVAETLIRSRARLSYQEAQALIDGEGAADRPPEIGEAVRRLRDLSRELMRKRAERGSLDFDLPEAEVILDEEGFPLDIQESVRLDSHRLIEEFMLLANEIVARRAQKRNVPFVYRIHEEPDSVKMENLRRFAAAFGHSIPAGKVTPKMLRGILERVEGKPEEKLLSTVLLRSLKQARYSVENAGHFGLASECYTHFTSPIRRYPDLLVHRVMKELANRGPRWAEADEEIRPGLAALADHASARERVAQEAERDSIDLKKVEFMERHLGETFGGTVSGVQAFGFFVRLDRYFVEGLVHVNTLDDDYYLFDEERYSLVGKHTARTFRLADPVEVQVARVDKDARQIDFALVGEGGGRSPRRSRRGAGTATPHGNDEKRGGAPGRGRGDGRRRTGRGRLTRRG